MKYVFIALTALSLAACGSADKKAPEATTGTTEQTASATTTIQWLDSTRLDMGIVPEGRVVEVSFRFKNTGTSPLVIADVQASCGCTVPETPEKPFAPGEEGVIRAKFDSKGRPNRNTKSVTVKANTPEGTHNLEFTVDVKPS